MWGDSQTDRVHQRFLEKGGESASGYRSGLLVLQHLPLKSFNSRDAAMEAGLTGPFGPLQNCWHEHS